ncbi:MAG: XRE family transcriptional regulator [Dehalococcoidia bacterium]
MFGERLKLARKKAGYSLRALSDALDCEVSAQAIGKYERGEMMPSSGVLMHLARTLDVSLEYLLSEQVLELEGVEFRKLSGTTARDRAQVDAEVTDRLQRYIAIEEILEVDGGAWKLPRSGSRFCGREEDGEVLADDLREEWELGIDPIPSMTALLEDYGIKVLVMPLPERVSGLTCLVRRPRVKAKLPVIVVNQHFTLERRRLTLAHELAHRLIDESSPVDHEKTAMVFAGAFLMPRDHLVREVGKHRKALGYKELVQLKRMYRVSAAALLVRLKQVGVIDQSTLAYAFQTFGRRWRKSEPDPIERPNEEGTRELPRRFERLCYRALAEQLIAPSKAAELLRQPLAAIEEGLKGPAEGDAHSR